MINKAWWWGSLAKTVRSVQQRDRDAGCALCHPQSDSFRVGQSAAHCWLSLAVESSLR